MMSVGVLRMKHGSLDLKFRCFSSRSNTLNGPTSQKRPSVQLSAASKAPRSTFTRRVDDYSGNALNPPVKPQVIIPPPLSTPTTSQTPDLPRTTLAASPLPTLDPMSVLSALKTLGRDGIPFDSVSICSMLQRCAAPSVMRQISTAQLCSAMAELGRLKLVPIPFPFLQAVMARTAADDFDGVTPRQLCCSLLWGLAAAGAQPLSTAWLLAALRALHAAVNGMDSRCIYSLCIALETWGVMEIIQQDNGSSRSRGPLSVLATAGPGGDSQTSDRPGDAHHRLTLSAEESSLSQQNSDSATTDGPDNVDSDATGEGIEGDTEFEAGDLAEDEDEDDLFMEWRSLVETSPELEADALGTSEGNVDQNSRSGSSSPETTVVISTGKHLVDRLWLRMIENLDSCTLHELGAVMCVLGSSRHESRIAGPGTTSPVTATVPSDPPGGVLAQSVLQGDDSWVSHSDAAAVLLAVEELLLVCTDTEEVEQVQRGLLRMGILVPTALQRTFRLRHQ